MSTDSSGVAMGRVEAVSDESSSQAGGVSLRDLSDLAAAIERVVALLAVDAVPAANGSDALERIADIAFVLHERDVEASLCDALDTAVHELAKAEQLKQANGERAQQALASLRELARRLNDMMAPAHAEQRNAPPAAIDDGTPNESALASAVAADKMADDTIGGDGLLAMEMREDEAFAQTVASLAASLHSLGEPDDVASDLQREAAVIAAPSSAVLAGAPVIESFAAVFLGEAGSLRTPPEPQALPDPHEDPGDLFEPLAGDFLAGEEVGAASDKSAAESLGDSGVEGLSKMPAPTTMAPAPPAAPPPAAAAVQPQAAPVPAANDPLAPVRALSEEELIALFS